MMPTDTDRTPNPTTAPSNFLTGLQNSFNRLGGIGKLKFPMTTPEVIHTLTVLQWQVAPRVIEILWGELQATWTADDVHRLGVLLHRNGFWRPYPSVHDGSKPVSLLAMEVSEYLNRCTPEARCEAIAGFDPMKLLTVLAGAVDDAAQHTLLEAAALKFNCLPIANE